MTESITRATKGLHRKLIDRQTGFDILDDFARFEQKNDAFSRASWDEALASKKAGRFFEAYLMKNVKPRKADGFQRLDYALRNAAWHIANTLRQIAPGRGEGFQDYFTLYEAGSDERVEFESARHASDAVKRAALMLGADLVGIAEYDERWHYSMKYRRQTLKPGEGSAPPGEELPDLPQGMTHCIVLAGEMPLSLNRTVPSVLSGGASGIGYSRDASTCISLAQFIRNLGYEAVACMNDTGPSIPYAIQAGLAEYSRAGIAITPEFGSRVRFTRVFTNLPLETDKPIDFGVRKFCDICRKCSDACPPKAIPTGAPISHQLNRSNTKGIRKWTIDAEKCFRFWCSQNTECSICIRVCPYNRTFDNHLDRLWRRLAGSRLRHMALWLDKFTSSHSKKKASWWWNERHKEAKRFSSISRDK